MGAYWILLMAVVIVQLQAILFRRFALKRLHYSRTFDVSACYEGDRFELVETIENRKPLPVPWLRVESQFRSGIQFKGQLNLDISEGQFNQNHKSFFSLMPWTKIVRKHHVTAARRGIYRLGTVSVTSGDLVGISTVVESLPLEGHLTIYPDPVDVTDMELPVQTWMGDMIVQRWIVPDPFHLSGVREYREGDSLKDIHWKASARSGEIQVHRKEATADSRLMIYLNVEDHEHMWNRATKPETIEYGIRLAAGISIHLLSQGQVVGFGSNATMDEHISLSPFVPPAAGMSQQTAIMEVLAALELSRSVSFHDYMESELRNLEVDYDMLVVTSYMNDKLERVIDRFRQDGHRVQIHLLDESGVRKEASA
ncbi:DUF58 domain-containing protein [Paenibacillus lemnae]|uniref:DUF58 domain-containing protein n=1 Tax=Paenibacillus lemnae TaxID=1330551 RepID=A0A848MAU0_PAELE|nr:DUF58 domain-containing protein [Paenibacillus lemnae]NMO97785.1 DUF58 domain-containing protein [Paenibacillus lemnae]